MWERELGVKVAVETMEFRDYLSALVVDPPQVFTINWIADYPSPYALYSLLLLPDATSNYGRWNDPEFVRLLEAASAAESEADQAVAYRAVDDSGRQRGAGHPVGLRRGVVAGASRPARPGQPDHGTARPGEGLMGPVARRAVPLFAWALVAAMLWPGTAAAFSGFGTTSADATYGAEMRFTVQLPGGPPDKLELLLRFTGSDSTFVAPVSRDGEQCRVRLGRQRPAAHAQHGSRVPVASNPGPDGNAQPGKEPAL